MPYKLHEGVSKFPPPSASAYSTRNKKQGPTIQQSNSSTTSVVYYIVVFIHVCPRIASRLCRTTRRTCGITKQNENSCITKKNITTNTYHPPHTIIAWETRNTVIKHTNKISTLTQSHTHQKSKCEKMDSNTGMYGVDYCHDIP